MNKENPGEEQGEREGTLCMRMKASLCNGSPTLNIRNGTKAVETVVGEELPVDMLCILF